MELHRKPIVFYSPGGFWEPLFALFRHVVDTRFAPRGFKLFALPEIGGKRHDLGAIGGLQPL